MENPSIDPRYDPAFQRGFDGTVATGTRAEVAARRSAPYVASALQRPVETRGGERNAAEPRSVAAVAPVAEPDVAEEPPAAAPVVVVQASAPVLRAPWTNPFAIGLTVVGIVVLALGVWLLQETRRMFESNNGFQTQLDYWFMQSTLFSAPLAIAIGLALLAGVAFLCAVYWSRRPDPA